MGPIVEQTVEAFGTQGCCHKFWMDMFGVFEYDTIPVGIAMEIADFLVAQPDLWGWYGKMG